MIVSKADLKTFIKHSGTQDDTQLDLILTLVQGRCESFTGRLFDYVASNIEFFDGDGASSTLVVHRFPIDLSVTPKMFEDQDRIFGTESQLVFEDDFFVNANMGAFSLLQVILPYGYQNLKVEYAGGYKTVAVPADGANVPESLKFAILAQAAHVYQIRNQLGIASVSTGGQSVSQLKGFELLPDVKKILQSFKAVVQL